MDVASQWIHTINGGGKKGRTKHITWLINFDRCSWALIVCAKILQHLKRLICIVTVQNIFGDGKKKNKKLWAPVMLLIMSLYGRSCDFRIGFHTTPRSMVHEDLCTHMQIPWFLAKLCPMLTCLADFRPVFIPYTDPKLCKRNSKY